jgi:membrane-bound lytic murein transglycosylase B
MFRVASPPLSRRAFLAGTAALAASAAITPAFASVSSFRDDIWRAAKARGVSRKVFDTAMGDFAPLGSVMALTRKQPESTSTAAQYLGKRITAARVGTGHDMRGEWSKTLAAVGNRYGVQGEAVLAIWGLETNYGTYKGDTDTVHALATLTYGGYRPSYFRDELLTALEVLDQGHVKHGDMIGSWAGAMGHPQFMPSSFMKYAVDFRGDGHKDIWNSVPDAQASTANYLKQHGWQPGETWGYEVKLPKGFDYAQVWSGQTLSLEDWHGQGVRRANGKGFPRKDDKARLLMPMGGHGPVFLVLANFDVIKSYNNSDLYALSVGHLADRIIGGREFVVGWPDDTKLVEEERAQVQKLLLRKGYAIGSADGELGPKTRAAVIDWQKRAGLLPDGHVGGALLEALRG